MHRTMIAVGVLAGLLVHSAPAEAQGRECPALCERLTAHSRPCALRVQRCEQLCASGDRVLGLLSDLEAEGPWQNQPEDRPLVIERAVGALISREPTLWRCGIAPSPARGRPCRGDMFSIDLPIAKVPNVTLKGNAPLLLEKIQRLPGLLETTARLRENGLTARIEPIFPLDGFGTPAGVNYVALDASDYIAIRHWRLTIVNKFGIPTHAPTAALCDIIDTVRRTIPPRGERGEPLLTDDQIFVARECDAVPQGEPMPLAQTSIHRLKRLSVIGAARDVSRVVRSILLAALRRPVDVAIIDGPITEAHAEYLGGKVHTVPGAGTFASGTSDQMHAAAMGALVKTFAPAARLHFFRGLEADVGTPNGNVARALHTALRKLARPGPDRRLVVNMSLGWPPEYNQASDIWLPRRDDDNAMVQCTESPIGQAVYSALTRLAAIQATSPGILAFAASGNRLLPAEAKPTEGPFTGPRFYPAQWGRGPVGWEEDAQAPTLEVHAVGRIGFHRRLALPEAVARGDDLAAPGFGVPLSPTSMPQLRTNIPELPVHATGTSVSTAIASGVITDRLGQGSVVSASALLQDVSTACSGAKVPGNYCPTQEAFDSTVQPLTGPISDWGATSGETEVKVIGGGEWRTAGSLDKARTGGLGPQPPGGLCPEPPCHARPRFQNQGSGDRLAHLRIELKLALRPGQEFKPELRVQWKSLGGVLQEARVPLAVALKNGTVRGDVPINDLPATPEQWKTATVQLVGMLTEPGTKSTERTVWLHRVRVQ